jgi:hypothetical protein
MHYKNIFMKEREKMGMENKKGLQTKAPILSAVIVLLIGVIEVAAFTEFSNLRKSLRTAVTLSSPCAVRATALKLSKQRL